MIKVGIIGSTGYTGLELIRLLHNHPNAKIIALCSRINAKKSVIKEFPSLIGYIDLDFITPNEKKLFECDIIFFATPHGVAMNSVSKFLNKDIKIIDLGADFRIKDSTEWSKWYGMPHTQCDLLKNAVYGLPEVYNSQIKNATLIANPGCYPTAIILALKPLLETNIINTKSIIADCKSGVSGAGRSTNIATLFCEINESLKPYNVNQHRHKPEAQQVLTDIAGKEVNFFFTPHLVPMTRGMLASIYVDLTKDINVQKLFEKHYQNNRFIHILPTNIYPQTKSVKGTNNCHISIQKSNNKLIIMSVIDNIIKGASGQAIQNMNLMFGLDEGLGLEQIGLLP
ncbi:MAG: N-acetyl-gamma-glutamyl-phosphate reductase [Candidatus Vesicomyosocius endoextente]|uniref:N-acetyl-gamma-glutamyl-phosphate reductase n=1 Tax=Candidatus Vesicomyosocius endoextente TaxID=2738853 RepID=A0A853G2P6_9GAMM|nr:N-acetyl-gamma-glutamyl-phosphate reductase [Candidatus Vesicomyosocius endoextente]